MASPDLGLCSLSRLSPIVFYSHVQEQQDPSHPDLIVICSWMSAQPSHIAKYLRDYRLLFSTSRVLLVRIDLIHFLYPAWVIRRHLLPAAEVIKGVEPSRREGEGQRDEGRPRILWHTFSNGGVKTNLAIRALLPELPPHVSVFDSCPGYYTYAATHAAMTASLPPHLRTMAWPILHAILLVVEVVKILGRIRPFPTENARLINLTDRGQAQRERRRLYCYGTGDEMVSWQDVEDHARKAKENGFAVRMEKFEGGKHVACARADKNKYWRAIKEIWEGF